MKVKIKEGATCLHDFNVGSWPYIGEHHHYPDKIHTIFNAIEQITPEGSKGWKCTAPGFGEKPYGCGAVYVYGEDSVHIVDSTRDTWVCPVCGSSDWDYDGFVKMNEKRKTSECVCNDCDSTWEENWSFTGYSKITDTRL